MALDTIPETLITGPFVTPSSVANNVNTFEIALVSSEWRTVLGVVVEVNLQQSFDNGVTWEPLCGFTATSAVALPPPHDGMPALEWGFPNRPKGNRRLRLTGTVSAPIRLGATITSS